MAFAKRCRGSVGGLVAGIAVVLALGARADATVLLTREGQSVERWNVDAAGVWRKQADFVPRGSKVQRPNCVAAADGEVFVGGRSGGIYRLTPKGELRGKMAEKITRVDAMAVKDGFLYAVTSFDENRNRLWRIRLSDGAVTEMPVEGIDTVRTLAFGADGLLYAASRGTKSIVVLDVGGAKAVRKAEYKSPSQTTGGLVMDAVRDRIVIPGVRPETIDLLTGEAKHPLRPMDFENSFAGCLVGDRVFLADYAGRIRAYDPKTMTLKTVATGAAGATSMVNLDEAFAARPARSVKYAYVYRGMPRKYDYEPMRFNHPGLLADLKTGLIVAPAAVDFDGDGDDDLILGNWGIPTWRGIWFFENAGRKDPATGLPVYRKPRKIAGGVSDFTVRKEKDGTLTALAGGRILRDFVRHLPENPDEHLPVEDIRGFSRDVHYTGQYRTAWRLADYDGDGRDDMLVGAGDWVQYGWHNHYDARGFWKNGMAHGYIYVVPNECVGDRAKWGKVRRLELDSGEPIDLPGQAVPILEDWDGDGDCDLIVGDFIDNFTYFENIGTRQNPVWTKGRTLRDPEGRRVHAELCIVTPFAVDLDRDGKLDFIAGEEDRVSFYRNTGKLKDGMPVFEQPKYLRQEADVLNLGILATPCGVDWDEDGDWDLIVGNSAGNIVFFENLSGPGVDHPKWAAPKFLSCEPRKTERDFASGGGLLTTSPIRLMAGPNGSIQGPLEQKWGYACLSVADWDGDGRKDVMVNTIWGKPVWFRNIGRKGAPRLAAPEGIEVEWEGKQPELPFGWFKPERTDNPKELITQWRTTPVMFDMNRDGLMDLVMVDQDGDLAFFERARQGGRLVLKAPRKAFRTAKGDVIHPTVRANPKADPSSWECGTAGCTGRRKLTICDWDGDGRDDLIMSGRNSVLYLQTEAKDGNWYFVYAEDMSDQQLAHHSTSPTTVDFDNDGIPEVVLGCEDGCLYYLKNNDR